MSAHTRGERAWAVYFREAFRPDGRWFVWAETIRDLRRDSLAAATWITPAEWVRQRRRGLVKCARVTVTPEKPPMSAAHTGGDDVRPLGWVVVARDSEGNETASYEIFKSREAAEVEIADLIADSDFPDDVMLRPEPVGASPSVEPTRVRGPEAVGGAVSGRPGARLFRKRPVVVEAHCWLRNGDHPDDFSDRDNGEGRPQREGMVVRYFRRPDVSGDSLCSQCGRAFRDHGWIDTLEDGHRVCPGDWIITGVKGERYPCKPDIFAATYEPANTPPTTASTSPANPRR